MNSNVIRLFHTQTSLLTYNYQMNMGEWEGLGTRVVAK